MKLRSRRSPPRVVGVISDTHGLVRPEAAQALAGVDAIVHAGDIGKPDVLETLERIAPTHAIRGNVDRDAWARDVPDVLHLEIGRHAAHVVHNIHDLAFDPALEGLSMVIAGHSHQPLIDDREGVMFLNPGSAGPRRFKLPVALALIRVVRGRLEPEIVELEV